MKTMAATLIFLLMEQPFTAAAQKPTIKEQVATIPNGSIIEVKLLQKGSSNIRGTLISVADEYFELQNVKSNTVSSEKVAFSDVKSVKVKRPGMSTGIKILVVAGAVLIVSGVLTLIAAVTGGLSQ